MSFKTTWALLDFRSFGAVKQMFDLATKSEVFSTSEDTAGCGNVKGSFWRGPLVSLKTSSEEICRMSVGLHVCGGVPSLEHPCGAHCGMMVEET